MAQLFHRRANAIAKASIIAAELGVVLLAVVAHAIERSEFWTRAGSGFHFQGPHAAHAGMFLYLYFLVTGVHALHVTIGVALIAVFAVRARWTSSLARMETSVDLLGLY